MFYFNSFVLIVLNSKFNFQNKNVKQYLWCLVLFIYSTPPRGDAPHSLRTASLHHNSMLISGRLVTYSFYEIFLLWNGTHLWCYTRRIGNATVTTVSSLCDVSFIRQCQEPPNHQPKYQRPINNHQSILQSPRFAFLYDPGFRAAGSLPWPKVSHHTTNGSGSHGWLDTNLPAASYVRDSFWVAASRVFKDMKMRNNS